MNIENILKESVELLRKMVATPSPSFEEDAVRDIVAGFLSGHGIAFTLLHNNIVAFNKHFSPAKRTLMLCAHLDTVAPAADYDFDPYNPDYEKVAEILFPQNHSRTTSEMEPQSGFTSGKGATQSRTSAVGDQVVAGLGSNDDGASVVSLIAVFRHFYEASMPINLLLVLSTQEERSGKGGMDGIWKVFKDSGIGPMDDAPDWAVVGEPTGMQAARAERGLLVIDAEAKGVSGHAARDEGVNAIYIAMEDIDRLRSFKFDKVSPLMGENKLTVTQINAGTAHNVVPDKCTFVVDIRPTEQYTNAELLAVLQSQCRSELRARNISNRSSATREGSPLLKAACLSGIPAFISPTTSDWMRITCDAVKMGPGDSSRSHRKNEYVTVNEIRDGITKYIEFIDRFAALPEIK